MWVALFATTVAHAAPDSALDPVMQLLAQHGLKPNGEMALTVPAAPAVPPPADAAPGLFDRLQTKASSMVITAMNFVGVRYKLGGNSEETGFDCSGFTRHIYELSVGLALPRRAEQQAKAPGLIAVARSALQPGDLVFFHTLKRAFSHVGIYIGDNRFIHSPSAGGQVRTEDMDFAYWRKRFDGARRLETSRAALSDAALGGTAFNDATRRDAAANNAARDGDDATPNDSASKGLAFRDMKRDASMVKTAAPITHSDASEIGAASDTPVRTQNAR